jgi:hypothetical protein
VKPKSSSPPPQQPSPCAHPPNARTATSSCNLWNTLDQPYRQATRTMKRPTHVNQTR